MVGSRRLLQLLPLLASTLAVPSWSPLGAPIRRDFILASSCSYSDAGAPLLAYGADLDTTTYVLQWAPTTGAWVVVSTHVPQFSQPYEHFSLRSRQNHSFVGLVINPVDTPAAGLSSILRSVKPGGGEDGMEGAYAFESTSWAFDVGDNGDIRAVTASANNESLSLTSYTADGWDSYPADDTWTPPTLVASPPGGVAAVTATRGVSDLYFAWAAGSDGAVTVASTPLNTTSAWTPLGAPFAGAALALGSAEPSLAWGGDGLNGVLCAAAQGASNGEVFVSCSRGNAQWAPAVVALTNVTASLAPGLAILSLVGGSVRVIVAGAASTTPGGNTTGCIYSAACDIPSVAGPPVCSPAALPDLCFPAAPVTDFDLSAPGPGQSTSTTVPVLLVAAVGPSDGTGDSMIAYTLLSR